MIHDKNLQIRNISSHKECGNIKITKGKDEKVKKCVRSTTAGQASYHQHTWATKHSDTSREVFHNFLCIKFNVKLGDINDNFDSSV